MGVLFQNTGQTWNECWKLKNLITQTESVVLIKLSRYIVVISLLWGPLEIFVIAPFIKLMTGINEIWCVPRLSVCKLLSRKINILYRAKQRTEQNPSVFLIHLHPGEKDQGALNCKSLAVIAPWSFSLRQTINKVMDRGSGQMEREEKSCPPLQSRLDPLCHGVQIFPAVVPSV